MSRGQTLKVFVVDGTGVEGGNGFQCVCSTLARAKAVVASLKPAESFDVWQIIECPVDCGRTFDSCDVKHGYKCWRLLKGDWVLV